MSKKILISTLCNVILWLFAFCVYGLNLRVELATAWRPTPQFFSHRGEGATASRVITSPTVDV